MADKNVKVELNVENLEGVAGGAKMSREELIRQGDPGADPLRDDPLNIMPKDDGKKSESNKGKIIFD